MHRNRKRNYTYFVEKLDRYSIKTILREGTLKNGEGPSIFQYYSLTNYRWKKATNRRGIRLIPITKEEITEMYRPIIEWPRLLPKE